MIGAIDESAARFASWSVGRTADGGVPTIHWRLVYTPSTTERRIQLWQNALLLVLPTFARSWFAKVVQEVIERDRGSTSRRLWYLVLSTSAACAVSIIRTLAVVNCCGLAEERHSGLS